MINNNTIFHLIIALALVSVLSSCGTARGLLHGSSTVLEGMASDARNVGDWMQ